MSGDNRRDNLPPIVVRTLVDHGPIEVSVNGNQSVGRVPTAPFEDVVHLFVPVGSATELGLLLDPRLHLVAKDKDGAYSLRMWGRAHAGVLLNRHPERASLVVWAPEGVSVHRTLVVPFVAEEVEFIEGSGDQVNRHAGLTPVGLRRKGMGHDLVQAAFSGMAGPLAGWSVVALTGWFGFQGATFPGRGLALIFSVVAALSLIAGVRMLTVSSGYLRWRTGRARLQDAPVLSDGLLAPLQVRKVAAVALMITAIALGTLATMWGSQLVMLVIVISGVWIVGPAWWVHLLVSTTEAKR